MLERLFEGKIWVAYGQVYVVCRGENLFHMDMRRCFGGQENGLCGAGMAGVLFLITGLHTGYVNFALELEDTEPALDDSWDEIVEASFVVDSPASPGISEWGNAWHPLKLEPGTYRARYHANSMEAGRSKDVTFAHEEPVDSYRLTLWRAPAGKDRVLKQTSEIAAYWHDCARNPP